MLRSSLNPEDVSKADAIMRIGDAELAGSRICATTSRWWRRGLCFAVDEVEGSGLILLLLKS